MGAGAEDGGLSRGRRVRGGQSTQAGNGQESFDCLFDVLAPIAGGWLVPHPIAGAFRRTVASALSFSALSANWLRLIPSIVAARAACA